MTTQDDRSTQPVAIVGMACRLPGAANKQEFLQVLVEGTDTVTEVPAERWTEGGWSDGGWFEPDPGAFGGQPPYRWGGFVDQVDRFDAQFFGVSPARAVRMDPQQRMLMETSWEAIEDAGWLPAALAGSRTGVFVGVQTTEYSEMIARNLDMVDGISALTCMTILSANLSHYYDLRGPCLSLDTACSSSLVALHTAVRSIRMGECDQALVAGTNLLLDPVNSLSLARGNMLSSKGRCRSFGAGVDGYVRAEGVGVVLLRPLDAARAAGDRCYAAVRGTAVNQDGRTGAITAPSVRAQVEVIRAALADSGLVGSDVDYVECHGTGTPIGDTVEARALGEALRDESVPADAPLLPIGSVKSNIGHTEAASGVIGLIKLGLMLHHGVLPASLHCDPPNPEIPFADLRLSPVASGKPWPSTGRPRRAGINSFGFGGTNAHAVLEEADVAESPEPRAVDRPVVLPLSARGPAALRRLVDLWADRLADPTSPLHAGFADAVRAAATERTHHPYRVAAVGSTPEQVSSRLRELALPETKRRWANGSARIAFVYTGQGGQQLASLAGELLYTDPEFAEVVRRCDAVVVEAAGWSILETLESGAELSRTEIVQPCMFAVQAGLTELWRSAGIDPVAVVGHSSGEVAAAYAAGVLDLEQACLLALRRGQAMADTVGLGRMMAVGRNEVDALALAGPEVSLAAVNGPEAVVLAGPVDALTALQATLRERGERATLLPGDYAYHSPVMEQAAAAFATGIPQPQSPAGPVTFFSSVDGKACQGTELTADYWRRNVRDTVRFADAVNAMLDDKIEVFLELGPRPVLASAVRDVVCARDSDERDTVTVLSSLDPKRSEDGVLPAVARLYGLGCGIHWDRFLADRDWAGPKRARVELPTYPWDRKRYWLPALSNPVATTLKSAAPPVEDSTGHPLLGQRLDIAVSDENLTWQGRLDTRRVPEFLDHKVGGLTVLPGVAYVELFVAAAREHGLGDRVEIRDLVFHQMLMLDQDPRSLQVTLRPHEDGFLATVHSRAAGGRGSWILHATGEIGTWTGPGDGDPGDAPELEPMPVADIYAALGAGALEYGPTFACLSEPRRATGFAAATATATGQNVAVYHCDPRLLDSALQLSVAAVPDDEASSAGVPLGFRRVRVLGQLDRVVDVRIRVRGDGDEEEVDARLTSRTGGGQCTIDGARFHLTSGPARAGATGARGYQLAWRPVPRTPAVAEVVPGRWLLVGDHDGLTDRVATALRRQGHEAIVAVPGPQWTWTGRNRVEFDQTSQAELDRLLAEVADGAVDLRGVVWLAEPAADGLGTPEHAQQLTESALRLFRAVIGVAGTSAPDLWLITRAARAVSDADRVAPAGAVLSGLVKAAQLELPMLTSRCLDLDPAGGPREAADLARELTDPVDESAIAFRGAERFVCRLVPAALGSAEPAVDPDGAYLITGGTGGLGLAVAKRLVERGAGAVALLARNVDSERALAAAAELSGGPTEVTLVAGDCGDFEQLAKALDQVRRSGRPLRGVVHAAGVLRDGSMLGLSQDAVSEVFSPKVRGGWHLHELTRQDPLEWFVLFASLAGVSGSPGQSNYCAANAFLDGLAGHRRALGLPATTIDWGAWAEVGMAAAYENSPTGGAVDLVGFIEVADGVNAFERLCGGERTQTVVVAFDGGELARFHSDPVGRSLYRELAAAAPTPAPALDSTGPSPTADDPDEVHRHIVDLWRRALGVEQVGEQDDFFMIGGDSIFAYQIVTQVSRTFNVTLDTEAVFQDFTVAAMTAMVKAAR